MVLIRGHTSGDEMQCVMVMEILKTTRSATKGYNGETEASILI